MKKPCSTRYVSRAVLGPLVLLLVGGCADAPTAPFESPQVVRSTVELRSPSIGRLTAVEGLLGDDFVEPLMVQAVGQTLASQVAVAFAPSLGKTEGIGLQYTSAGTGSPELFAAIHALGTLNLELHGRRSGGTIGSAPPEGIEDPELRIVRDALALVLDDALTQLLTVADSIGH